MLALRMVIAGLAIAAVTACGDSSPPSSAGSETPTAPPTASADATPKQRLAEVRQATQDAGSSRVIFDQSVTADALPGGGQQTSGEGAFAFAPEPTGSMTVDTGALGELESRIVDGTVYFKFPESLRASIGLTTPWVKVGLDDLNDAGQLAQLNSSPTAQLDLVTVVKDVKEVGDDVIRGDNVTHYKTALDLRALEELPEASKAQLQQLRTIGVNHIPLDIWIDDQNRMRRLSLTVDLTKAIAAGGGAGGGKVEQTFEMYDYGVEVDVAAPPDDQVTALKDVPALSQALGGQR